MPSNQLYYGDNLPVLREHVADDTIDLVYLDPPFNSNQDYNVLFAEQDGSRAEAQLKAFGDTWRWDQGAARIYAETVENGPPKVAHVLRAFRSFVGENDMLAYLTMMAPRLVELRRVLRRTGSIFLHCDPTASHYLKILMDAVFGPNHFRNELVWKRTSTVKGNHGQGTRFFPRVTDSILYYTKSDEYTFSPQFTEYTDDYLLKSYRHVEPETGRRYRLVSMIGPGGAAKGNPYYEVWGVSRYWRYSQKTMQSLIDGGLVVQTAPGTVPQRKYYLDEGKGVAVQSLWADIGNLQAAAAERLGYPTQKPEALLERIIAAASMPGDVVLDPFCGCGTAIAAAERLHRQWIGIDITQAAITLIRERLSKAYPDMPPMTVVGEPTTVHDAAALARAEPYQFQWWALGLVGARVAEQKKGPDGGIDGRQFLRDGRGGHYEIIYSVKSGKLKPDDIRALGHVVTRESAALGVLITLHEPSPKMRADAASGGWYDSPWGRHPRLQIITVGELLAGGKVDRPYVTDNEATFKAAPRVREATSELLSLALDAEPTPSAPSPATAITADDLRPASKRGRAKKREAGDIKLI